MSTGQTKTSGGGGGRNKAKNANATANSVHSDHTKTEKEKPHIKPTAEQIRIAQITDIKSNVEDPKIREKVDQLMETTQRSEEDVCYALYECDNDVEKAVIYLLETLEVGAFATTSKKKKNRAASNTGTGDAGAGAGSGTIGAEDWDDVNNNAGSNATNNHHHSGSNNVNNNHNLSDNRDRSRGRGGMRGGGGAGRGRPRDNNNYDGNRPSNNNYGDRSDKGGDSWRGGRGRGTGGSRGSYGAGSRGGRGGGRLGPRTPNYRDNQNSYRSYRQDNQQEIDSWDSTAITTDIITNKTDENWGDWDNEEYTGSLSDTKVFTPSTANQGSAVSNPSELSAPPGLEQQILNPPSQQDVVQQYSSTAVVSGGVAGPNNAASANNNVQYPELHSSSTAAQHLRQALEMPQLSQSTSLSAEQSQYFNTLSSQNANVNSYQSSAVQYGQYGDHQVSSGQAPQVRRQRARVPPPSKIPSSAVEMPGDLNSMGFLDVQFGGLDVQFGTEETFDGVTDKFSAASINDQSNDVSDYQSKQGSTGVSKAPPQSSGLSGLGDSIGSGQNDNLTSNYVQRGAGGTTGGSALDPLVKSDPYIQTSNPASAAGYQNLSYTPTSNKSSSYQSAAATQAVYNNSNNYSSGQPATSNYPPASNTYSTYNQNSYQSQSQVQGSQQSQQQQQQPQQTTQNSLNSAASVPGSSANSNIPVNSGGASTNTNPNYLSNQSGYPSVGQSQFGSQSSTYQSNNVYGNTGLSNSSGYSGSTGTAAAQYSNYNSSKLKDTPVSSTAYDGSSSNVASNVTSAVSNNSAITTSSISSPSSLGLTNTKATTNSSMKSGVSGVTSGGGTNASATGGGSSGGSGANSNVVQNIPVVSQFIQTAGVPYYQQQFVQYEDIQLVQPRMTHMPGYYDLNYQTPTSMGAGGVRDGTTGNLGTVAYSTMTDGRFARTDNNSSPVSNVPSTISQQTASGGPMLNIPPYTTVPYFYGANMMPGGFQQAYPQIYPQQMATANPTSGGQYAKPSSYSYGSTGYDTTQDYNVKTAYQSAGVGQQSKGQNVSNQSAGNSDISSSMYSKSHVALNKVNSYDKQSFHSGTPPPFNLAGVNSQTAGVNSQTQAYGQHLFIPAAMTAHHNIGIHHQMQIDGSSRIPNTSRRDTNTGQRQQSTTQSKTGTKTGYSQSYWTTQN